MSRPNFLTLRPKKVANDWDDALIFASVKGFVLKLSLEGTTCIFLPFLSFTSCQKVSGLKVSCRQYQFLCTNLAKTQYSSTS